MQLKPAIQIDGHNWRPNIKWKNIVAGGGLKIAHAHGEGLIFDAIVLYSTVQINAGQPSSILIEILRAINDGYKLLHTERVQYEKCSLLEGKRIVEDIVIKWFYSQLVESDNTSADAGTDVEFIA